MDLHCRGIAATGRRRARGGKNFHPCSRKLLVQQRIRFPEGPPAWIRVSKALAMRNKAISIHGAKMQPTACAPDHGTLVPTIARALAAATCLRLRSRCWRASGSNRSHSKPPTIAHPMPSTAMTRSMGGRTIAARAASPLTTAETNNEYVQAHHVCGIAVGRRHRRHRRRLRRR